MPPIGPYATQSEAQAACSSGSSSSGSSNCGEQYSPEDNWAYFCDGFSWALSFPGTCPDPGTPPFACHLAGETSYFECHTCQWFYNPLT